MSDFTVNRLGSIQGGADKTALFLKVFSGEVLTAFNNACVMMDKHSVRSISSGKSAQFPAIGKTTAAYHTPGAELLGQAINHNERIITIDDLLVSHVTIANIDDAMNHYDVRSEYTKQMADALAQTFDKNVLQVAILAAREAATQTQTAGGSVTAATSRTDGAVMATAFFSAAEELDEKSVPEADRYGAVLPAQYYLLARTTDVINRDWDGRGSYADGKVFMIAGIPVVKTNNLPQAAVATGPAAYQGDFTNTSALIWQKGAAGTVKLLDMATESEYSARHQATFMVSKYAVGHGILRPACAVEVKVA